MPRTPSGNRRRKPLGESRGMLQPKTEVGPWRQLGISKKDFELLYGPYNPIGAETPLKLRSKPVGEIARKRATTPVPEPRHVSGISTVIEGNIYSHAFMTQQIRGIAPIKSRVRSIVKKLRERGWNIPDNRITHVEASCWEHIAEQKSITNGFIINAIYDMTSKKK